MSVYCWFSQTHTIQHMHMAKGRCFAVFHLLILLVIVACLLSGAGRDLSAREMVVLSNLKATDEPYMPNVLKEKKG